MALRSTFPRTWAAATRAASSSAASPSARARSPAARTSHAPTSPRNRSACQDTQQGRITGCRRSAIMQLSCSCILHTLAGSAGHGCTITRKQEGQLKMGSEREGPAASHTHTHTPPPRCGVRRPPPPLRRAALPQAATPSPAARLPRHVRLPRPQLPWPAQPSTSNRSGLTTMRAWTRKVQGAVEDVRKEGYEMQGLCNGVPGHHMLGPRCAGAWCGKKTNTPAQT